mmetsp:Transcript_16026/g.39507  ORF Transcript_16026/g.39507 Transcript_16026/m.39507 type:complete len:89 (-) Transcript_16026:1654-1920(-)
MGGSLTQVDPEVLARVISSNVTSPDGERKIGPHGEATAQCPTVKDGRSPVIRGSEVWTSILGGNRFQASLLSRIKSGRAAARSRKLAY